MSKIPDIPSTEEPGAGLNWLKKWLDTMRLWTQIRDPNATQVGDSLDKFVTRGELVGQGVLVRKSDGGYAPGATSTTPGPMGPVGPSGPPGSYTPDLTPPPTPTGLAVTAGLTQILIEWDAPTYTQGQGNGQTNIYGAIWTDPDPEPVFVDVRTKLIDVAGKGATLWSYATPLNTRWCIWIKWQSVDGVESTSPAGGAHGVQGTTGKIGTADLNPLIVTAAELADNAVVTAKIANAAVGLNQIADNAVSVGKLLVTGRGGVMNDDPGCIDPTAWELVGFNSTVSPTSPYGDRALECLFGTPAVAFALSRPARIDQEKNYLVSMWARQMAGAGTCYLSVAFYDSAYTLMTGGAYPTGWPSTGTYHYFGLVNQQPPGGWVEYSVAFGPDEIPQIPPGAAFVRIGVLGNYTITTPTSIHHFAGLRLEKKNDADLIVNGGILARHLSAGSIAVGTAAIQNGALVNAMIANATIDDAKIANLSAAKLTAGVMQIGSYIQSQSFVSGTSGWKINSDGTAEFQNVTVRGTLNASDLTLGTLNVARIANGALTQMWSDEEFSGAAIPASTADTVVCEVAVTEPSNPTFTGWARATFNISRPAYAGETGVQVKLQQRKSGVWSTAHSFPASWPSSAITFFVNISVETSWVYDGTPVTDWRVAVAGNLLTTHTAKGTLVAQTFVK